MKIETLELLQCPGCTGQLEVAQRLEHSAAGAIKRGVLGCASCAARYPILDWIPRILPPSQLTPPEVETVSAAAARSPADPQVVKEERLSPEEFRSVVEARVRAREPQDFSSDKMRDRFERDVAYLVEHTEEKGKFVRTAATYLGRHPRRIVEIGGGQGGTLSAFREHYRPGTALAVDLDPTWVELARLRDPDTEIVRGDATRLPLRDGCMDFLCSVAMLEHVPDWRSAVSEMLRVSGEGLLSYNPNAGFPYDAGHLDAPLVTWLPKNLAAEVAYASHRLRGTGRSRESIRAELAVTYYRHRLTVARELRSHHVQVINAFGEFLRQTIQDDYHLRAGRALRLLRRYPWIREAIAFALVSTGTEPNVYLYYRVPVPWRVGAHDRGTLLSRTAPARDRPAPVGRCD
jgi:SAM-dependent methyltransferase/uncharacterized protein YbaR (Trm112 family)